ncbi:ATPase [Kluyveromyces marxianus]
MDQTIRDISEIFESMDYKVTKMIQKRQQLQSQSQSQSLSQSQCQCNRRKLKLSKLANLFDFGEVTRRHSRYTAAVAVAQAVTDSNKRAGTGAGAITSYSFQPVTGIRSSSCAVVSPGNDSQSESDDALESELASGSSLSSGSDVCSAIDYQNLLGFPPPKYIEPALNTTRSASSEIRRNKQAQLLLHDLISGDICDI